MATGVIAQKWRPKIFDEVVGQSHVTLTLKNALKQKYLHHAYLFTGTRGVGKTTIARILAKALNCQTGITNQPCGSCDHCIEIADGNFIDVLEIDAASRTKVEDTRDILTNAQYTPTKGRFKIYLIDEVHMLSKHSFNALLKTLEEPPTHIKFLLATTEPKALPITVLSRCLQFHLTHITEKNITGQLAHILTHEKISFETTALSLIAQAAQGSMRDALSLLNQAISYSNGNIQLSDMQTMLHVIDAKLIQQLLQHTIAQDANKLMPLVDAIDHQGIDGIHLIDGFGTLLHEVAITQQINTHTDDPVINTFAQQLTIPEVQWLYETVIVAKKNFHLHPTSKIGLKVLLLKLLNFRHSKFDRAKRIDAATQTTTSKAKPSKPTTTSSSFKKGNIIDRWMALLPKLKITGVANMLLQYCQPLSFEDNCLHLGLHIQQKPLLQTKYIKRIESALQTILKQDIRVKITLSKDPLPNTPYHHAAELKKQQHRQAKEYLSQDSRVQTIKKKFDADILHDSIELL
jgi:DNA polymerase-3 subunit gamma/tau